MNQLTQPKPTNFPFVPATNTNNELNDRALFRFLQTVVVGIVGLPDTMVRPRWQEETPTQPDFGVDWCAIGCAPTRERDVFANVSHTPGVDTVNRNQILAILASFYGPNCEANSELLVMGLSIQWNRILLAKNQFGLVSVDEGTEVPAYLKDRWIRGIDVPFRLRRQQIYTYNIPDVAAVPVTIDTNDELEEGIVAG